MNNKPRFSSFIRARRTILSDSALVGHEDRVSRSPYRGGRASVKVQDASQPQSRQISIRRFPNVCHSRQIALPWPARGDSITPSPHHPILQNQAGATPNLPIIMPRSDGDRQSLHILRQFLGACSAGDDTAADLLFQLRRHLLFHGVADDQNEIRGLIWKTLLGVESVSAERYCALIRRGPCEQYQKIRSDSFRTFPNEKSFQNRVSENSMIRLLNSFVHENAGDGFRYLQGMNAISGPFLYCMGELDAHATFSRFVKVYCPTYWVQSMLGPRAGCILLDQCLSSIDRELFDYLKSKNLIATVYAFPLVSSMLCCLQPFSEVLKLWDFLIAFGLHLNILTIIAQMILIRDSLIHNPSPNAILNYRKWPALNAKLTIAVTLDLVNRISPNLMELIEKHTYSTDSCQQVQSERNP